MVAAHYASEEESWRCAQTSCDGRRGRRECRERGEGRGREGMGARQGARATARAKARVGAGTGEREGARTGEEEAT